MSTVIFRTDDGSPLSVRGYLALFDTLSVPMPQRGGLRELIAPGSFDAAMRRGEFSRVPIRAWHMPHATLATPRDASIAVWADRRGVCFEATNIAVTASAASVVNLIAAGELCGASFKACLHGSVESVSGARTFVVRKVDGIEDIGLSNTFGGCYPSAACWLGHGPTDGFAPHFRDLAQSWEAGRSRARPGYQSAVFNRAVPPVDVFTGLPPQLAAAMRDTALMMQRAAERLGIA